MLTELFLKLLNMGITASWLVLAVVAIRGLFRKMPRWISCLLWGVVALRLVVPVSVESTLSLIPSAEVIPQEILVSQTPAIHSGIPAVNSAVNPVLNEQLMQGQNLPEKLLSAAAIVWLAGVAILLLYSIVSYCILRFRIRASVSLQKDIRICDDIYSPFVLGMLFPRIYLPSGMEPEQTEYVLAHERAHIHRRDHWWKPLGYVLLTVYWFNPLLWLAYILLCRDIERACDEKVIAKLDSAGKKGYSQALLACGAHRRMIMACPVAFGEVSVKSRVKGVLHYKKPSFWILLLSVAACAVTAVCFLTNPVPCSHDYRSQTVTPSTCAQQGIQSNTCILCKHNYFQPMEKLSHSYDESANCIHCGNPQCVHDIQEIVLIKATDYTPGKGVQYCTLCGYRENRVYPALDRQQTASSGITGGTGYTGYTSYASTNTACDMIGHIWIAYGNGTKRCSCCDATGTWGPVSSYQQNSFSQSPLSPGSKTSTNNTFSGISTPGKQSVSTGTSFPSVQIYPQDPTPKVALPSVGVPRY